MSATEKAMVKAMTAVFDMPWPDTMLVSFWPYTTIQEFNTRETTWRTKILMKAVKDTERQLANQYRYRRPNHHPINYLELF
jgi:hypothetical protein